MELQEYLEKYNISITDLSKICGISNPVFYKMLKGGGVSRFTARLIYKKTKGILNYQNIYKPKGRPKREKVAPQEEELA